MPRPEKVQAVAEIKERIEGAQAVFLAEYAGLSVKDQQALRRELRAQGAEFKVVKMTLARRAAAELEIDSLDELLLGPTGLTFSDGDPVTAAKALKDFAKDHEVFVIKGGLLGDEFLTPETISKLADIEPRDVLLAKLAGAMKAPMANMAGLMAALPRNAASMFQQLLEKKEAEAPAAEVEETVVEEATDEAPAETPEAEEPSVEDASTEEAPAAEAEEAADESADDADASDATDEPEASDEVAATDDSAETEDAVASDDAEPSDDGAPDDSDEDQVTSDDAADDQTEASTDDAEEE